MNFMDKNEFECPYCHGKLDELVWNGVEVKLCTNEKCEVGLNKRWEVADFGGLHD